jgi:hypothetical protein
MQGQKMNQTLEGLKLLLNRVTLSPCWLMEGEQGET